MTNTTDTPAAALRAWAREAQALAEQATPGEWFHAYGPDGDEFGVYPEPVGTREIYQRRGNGAEFLMECATEADAELIAAARTAVPQLARVVVTLVEALEWYSDQANWELADAALADAARQRGGEDG